MINAVSPTRRRTTDDLLARLPPSPARSRAREMLPERLLRAEMPSLDASPSEIANIKQEMAQDLAPFEAMHVLACLVATQAFSRPEVYSELDDDSGATIEYVASILLERPSPAPVGEPGHPSTMGAAIQRTLDRTRGLTLQLGLNRYRREDQAETALDAIAATVETHDALSRWPGYAKQAQDLITELAADEETAALLREELGFDLTQALQLESAVGSLLTSRYNQHGERTAETVDALEAELDRDPAAVPPPLRARDDKEHSERGLWMLAQEHFSEHLRDALVITAADLAARADIEITVAESFLRTFSNDFGSTRGTNIVTGRNQVRQRPFVTDGEGRYLLTLPGNLLWGMRPVAEATIKRHQAAFHKYESARSAYTERECARQLRTVLKSDDVWTNALYWLDGKRYEADVIARVDDVCIVVEVKSGELSGKAWRGRRSDLRRGLEALIGESSTQCERLATELRAGRVPEFIDRSTHRPFEIPLDEISRVEAAVVTLESLGFVGMAFPRLREAGLLGDEGNEAPWIVSLYDLAAIATSCQYTPQFTAYVRRRRSMDERVAFMDECDLWMLHLRETLDFGAIRANKLFVEGRSDDLNKAWMFGSRMPTMKLDKSSKRRLRELDRKRPNGFVRKAEAVIADAQRGRRPRVRTF